KMLVWGPYPADGFFARGLYLKFDAILAMYHDQGLIPFKLLAQGAGVNFTAGMNFVRTSPDHGTAYDIAGKGKASIQSTRDAVFLAIEIFKKSQEYKELQENALHTTIPKELLTEDSI
ncbi:MAG: 4-hydroxythreonine-4-phosphate dehydrogenase PdxA, partial [Bacteroidia bacterium]|nr:4-hydroxythreonine-4-phosphate dehydrogenase PdxA [Bacteroidia bacterium]